MKKFSTTIVFVPPQLFLQGFFRTAYGFTTNLRRINGSICNEDEEDRVLLL